MNEDKVMEKAREIADKVLGTRSDCLLADRRLVANHDQLTEAIALALDSHAKEARQEGYEEGAKGLLVPGYFETIKARARQEAIEECAKKAEETSTCELREFGRGELRHFSGKKVRLKIATAIRGLKHE